MSSLTKFIKTERHRASMSDEGGLKTPMMLQHDVPADFDTACITLPSGEPHLVRVVQNKPVRTGFFELDIDDEDEFFTKLVDFLYDQSMEKDWGGVAQFTTPDEDICDGVYSYFSNFDLKCQHLFVGVVGFAFLLSSGVLDFPDDVPSDFDEDINHDILKDWMEEHLCVGKVNGDPVYYNEHLKNGIVFSARPKYVGVMTRIGGNASIMIHNFERSTVLAKVMLGNDDGKDVSEQNTIESKKEN